MAWVALSMFNQSRILSVLGCIFAIHIAAIFPNGFAGTPSFSSEVGHFIPAEYVPYDYDTTDEFELEPLPRDLLIRYDDHDEILVPMPIITDGHDQQPHDAEDSLENMNRDGARMDLPIVFDYGLPYDDIGSHGELGEITYGRSDVVTQDIAAVPVPAPVVVSVATDDKKVADADKDSDADADDDTDDDDDDDQDDHGYDEYPYGYGGWNTRFGQPKKGKLGSRRQDWDYRNHQHYPYHNPGPHPLDKYYNYGAGGGWSYGSKYHGKFSKYGSGYSYPKLSAKLAAKYHLLKYKIAKKAAAHAHHHYYGW